MGSYGTGEAPAKGHLFHRPPLLAIAEALCSATLSRYMAVTAALSAPPASPLELEPPTPPPWTSAPDEDAAATEDNVAAEAATSGSSSYIQSSSAISALRVTRRVSKFCCRRRTRFPSLQWMWSPSSWSCATRLAAASARLDWVDRSTSAVVERRPPPAAEEGGL